MERFQEPGLCTTRCELDDYYAFSDEVTLMTEIADIDPFPSDEHQSHVDGLKTAGTIQLGIAEDCRRDAVKMPCKGYREEGVRMGFGLGVMHCPLLIRHFAGAVE
jgi:hypothetical protein